MKLTTCCSKRKQPIRFLCLICVEHVNPFLFFEFQTGKGFTFSLQISHFHCTSCIELSESYIHGKSSFPLSSCLICVFCVLELSYQIHVTAGVLRKQQIPTFSSSSAGQMSSQRALFKIFAALVVIVAVASTASASLSPSWKKGRGWLSTCARTATVLGVTLCASDKAWKTSPKKLNHIANVVAQLLDNDEDGKVDSPDLVKYMVDKKLHMWIAATEEDSESSPRPEEGFGQMTGIWEAAPNSCDFPVARGASLTDRGTWAAAKDTQSGCSPDRDATTEEVLHLISEAARNLYPKTWGATNSSKVAAAIGKANGDCGWGFLGTYKNPSSECVGKFAYDDKTCEAVCILIEGIYWAIVSHIGGLYTTARAKAVSNEWLMCTPDDGMPVVPSGVRNAATLQSGSPELYRLVSDTKSPGHEWVPSVMPDGKYKASSKDKKENAKDKSPEKGKSSFPVAAVAAPVGVAVVLAVVAAVFCCFKQRRDSS